MSEKSLIAAAIFGGMLCVPPAAYAGSFTSLYSFGGTPDAGVPLSGLVAVGDQLYGTSLEGGIGSYGSVFQYNPASNHEIPIYSFTTNPRGPGFAPGPINLTPAHGFLYGATASGIGTYGSVFKLIPHSGALTTLYQFVGGYGDLLSPNGVVLTKGMLFGTAGGGNLINNIYNGGVFSINPVTGIENTVHVFTGGADGGVPGWGLTTHNGTLFGTTELGGAHGDGVVFKIDLRSYTQSVVHDFLGATDGSSPLGLISAGSLLYGVANAGGANGDGTLFSIDASTGAETTLHSFAGATDGSAPVGNLTLIGTYLYGTTNLGGNSNQGVLFRINTATGAEDVLHSFKGKLDGGDPIGTLLYTNGVLYGTTASGGATGNGTIFQYVP